MLLVLAGQHGTSLVVQDGPGGIAAVNATILAILFAVASGYAFVALQVTDRMGTEFIEAAAELRRTGLTWWVMWPDVYDPLGKPFGQLMADFQELAAGLRTIKVRDGAQLFTPAVPPQSEPQSRAYALISITSAIAFRYPFPASTSVVRTGEVDEQPKIKLTSEREVRAWLADLRPAITRLRSGLDKPDAPWRSLLVGVEEAESRTDPPAESSSKPESPSLHERFLDFIDWLEQISELSRAVDLSAERLDRYRARLIPRRRTGVPALFLVVGLFGIGVALPMVWAGVPRLLYAWIPAVAYVLALVWAAHKVAIGLWGRETRSKADTTPPIEFGG
jgi:hypothetical protein